MTSTSDATAALLFDDVLLFGGTAAAAAAGNITSSSSTPVSLSVEHSSAMTTRVIVHPLVLLHVLDHHTRRQEESGRVIGTLLGRRDGQGTVEVTNCFAVPHAERGDEVAIGKDFNKRMLSLYLRSNRRETVVGWYASTAAASVDSSNNTANGGSVVASTDLVTDTSSLIHEFYAGECGSAGSGDVGSGHHGGGDDPVHLVIDTRLVTDQISIRAYKSTPIIVQGEPLGNLFHELRLDLQSTEPETICVHEMMALEKMQQQQQQTLANITNGNTTTSDAAAAAANSKDPSVALRVSVEKLYALLEQTLAYVDAVVENKTKNNTAAPAADPEVGRQLADALASVPRIRPHVFDALFRESLQDLLMVTYLSNVTRTQLTIAEKLNASLGV
jgi:translation initiation factor 3 subunit F